MVIFIAALAALCLYKLSVYGIGNAKPAGNPGYFNDYLSIEKTNAIKGVFIIIVFLSHTMTYITLSTSILDRAYDLILLNYLNQSMVSMFLFYSGFGIMLSVDKKGKSYVAAMPKNRLLKTLLHFDIAVILFGIVQAAIGNLFSIKNILLSLTGWEALGNSNWYIFVILCLYLITYLAFTMAKDNHRAGLLITVLLCCALIAVLYFFKQRHWYDTILCYPLGMLYYQIKDKLHVFLFKKKFTYWLVTGAVAVLFAASLVFRFTTPGAVVKNLLFAVVVVLVTMKVSVNNKILQFFGKNLFSLYILQRLPMILLAHWGLNSNKYLFTVLSFGATVLLAVGFDYCLKKLDGVLFKKKV